MKTVYLHSSESLIPPIRGKHLFWSARKKHKGYTLEKELFISSDMADRLIGPDCGLKIDAEIWVRDGLKSGELIAVDHRKAKLASLEIHRKELK